MLSFAGMILFFMRLLSFDIFFIKNFIYIIRTNVQFFI